MHNRNRITLRASLLLLAMTLATALEDALFTPQNARDRWLPDAIGIAGATHGPEFLFDVLAHDMPANEEVLEGVARAIRLMTQAEAVRIDADTVVTLIQQVPILEPAVGAAILEGIASGWPEETAPGLTDLQRIALAAARSASAADLDESFTQIAERWSLPDVSGN